MSHLRAPEHGVPGRGPGPGAGARPEVVGGFAVRLAVLKAEDLSTEQNTSVGSLCDSGEVLISMTDLDLLSDTIQSTSSVNFEACFTLEEDLISLQASPSGAFLIEICAPLSERVDLSNRLSGEIFPDCERPSYWHAVHSFKLIEAPNQVETIFVSPSCDCD